jgi:NADPH:quinone reductase-like Zn-dependent oxidoreductase
MRAVRLHEPGGVEALRVEEVATPDPGPEDVLVQVHAAAITRDELEWPTDRLPATPSYELSGVVVAIGPEAEGVKPGDAVYALTGFDRDGAAAEYALVSAPFLAPKPRTLDHVQSSAIPLAALSAWQGLFVHGRLERGQRVLIHGAAGGVGHFAVQLARRHGAHVIGTTSPGGVDAVRALGVDEVIDHTAVRFEDAVEPVDLVFDSAGGERLERSPAVVKKGGRLVSVATDPPSEAAAARGIEAVYFVVEPNRAQLVEIAALVDAGDLRPTIDTVYPLAQARTAFERTLGVHGTGKIVLRVVDE